jgi:hypothetical protein
MKRKKRKERAASTPYCSGVPSRGTLYVVKVFPEQVEDIVKDQIWDVFLSVDVENAMEVREACLTLMRYCGLPEDYEPMERAMKEIKRETKRRK